MAMKEFWKRIEILFDKLIVPALVVLLIIVVADIFFTEFKYKHEIYFLYADIAVITVFVGDLSFKFKRAKNWQGFLKKEWLEILAVIPFFWIFRLVESVVRVGELLQEIIHLVARGGRFVRLFAALGLTSSRHERFSEFLRKITGTDRFEDTAEFFKHPNK